ncbi:ABC transporter permease [Vibrio hippocampi]|uniref:Spermidine/putrescine transport system permease protein PotB n=1 Tax=Vibrio hippocampi TaxID=654686 RepID=A0ABM8ZHI5_9VIBR|nr:ABC transporter permease [Vibrio hippocampi]CAH0526176.1 Spermidine/putrescine transport system permease protein PotB [Vibrio hippocampi]
MIHRLSTHQKWAIGLFLAPACVWLVALILIPHVQLLELAFSDRRGGWTTRHFEQFFAHSLYWNTFIRTAWMSLLATLFTLLLAFPIAYYIAKIANTKNRLLLVMVCILPFWLSELVRAYGWMIVLRESGLLSHLLVWLGVTEHRIEFLYNDYAIIMGLIYNGLLFMLVPLISALDSLDNSHIEAAFDLGASRWVALTAIVIPHAMPGIVSGCIIVFMLSLGNYLIPSLMGGKDSLWFTEQIFTQFITRFNWEQGSALGLLLLILSSLLVWLGLKISGQSLQSTVGR